MKKELEISLSSADVRIEERKKEIIVKITEMKDLIDIIHDPVVKEKLEKLSSLEKIELLIRIEKYFHMIIYLEEVEAYLSTFDFDKFHKEVYCD